MVVAAIGLLVVAGCATYTDDFEESRDAISKNDLHDAIDEINKELEVDEIDGRPASLDDEKALLLLERATLLQGLGKYDSAARDMITVDDRLEILDIGSDRTDTIVRHIYSDDAGPYRAPPHERLLLNTMNMINFLAQGDTSGARVEARRFDIMQRFFVDDQSEEMIADILGFGNYIAGAAFEAAEDYDNAARYYVMAHMHGTWPEADDDRLLDLINVSGYRGAGLGERREQADSILNRAEGRERIDTATYRDQYQRGDTLVVVQTGMTPYRSPKRVSLADALTYSDRSPYASVHLTSTSRDQASALYSQGLVTWLNTTELTRDGLSRTPSSVRLDVNDDSYRLTDPIDIGRQVEEAWEMVSSTALAAAISRTVARAAAGTLTKAVVEAAAEGAGASAGASRLTGWLAGMILQGSLAAADTPDTRSWTTLPDNLHLVRLQLDAGDHHIGMEVGDQRDERRLEVNPDRFNLVNFSELR